MFGKKNQSQASPSADASVENAEAPESEASEAPAASGPLEPGPYDAESFPGDEIVRLDFGSLQIPGVEGMNVNLEVDEQSQSVVAVTVILGEGGVQLQAFAAPRSGGFWDEILEELSGGINGAGGQAEIGDGPLGKQLKANVPAQDEQGQPVLQAVRFVGVEGPRWVLRGVMLGAAAVDERAAEVFEDVFRACIVSRGQQPMAPGELLPLRIPEDAVAEGEEGDDLDDDDAPPPLNPFERGPEITEIR